ncbi:MAG: hypothetical protein CM15mV135_090 [uncultured marine virus]|nr:MAG: hypothetical protein CM15mV135_090 [uncultured marine virus]
MKIDIRHATLSDIPAVAGDLLEAGIADSIVQATSLY